MTVWQDVLIVHKSSLSAFNKIKEICKNDDVRYYRALSEIDISDYDRDLGEKIPSCATELDASKKLGLPMSATLNLTRRIWSGLLHKAWENKYVPANE